MSANTTSSQKSRYKFGDLLIKPTVKKITKDKDYQVGDLTKSLLPNDVRKKVVGGENAQDVIDKHRTRDNVRRRSGVSNLIITFDERVSTISSEVKKFADHVNEVLVGQYVPTVDLSAISDSSQTLDGPEVNLHVERRRLTAATREMKDNLADLPASAKASKLYQKVFTEYSKSLNEFEDATKKLLHHERESRDRAMSLSFPGEETAELQQVRLADEQASKIAAIVLERNARIQDAQADMLKLHEVFRDMSMLTAHQGEQIQVIEDNAAASHENVERAAKQLSKAEEYTNRYRRMLCYGGIFLTILAAAAAAVVYFLVLKPASAPPPAPPAPPAPPVPQPPATPPPVAPSAPPVTFLPAKRNLLQYAAGPYNLYIHAADNHALYVHVSNSL